MTDRATLITRLAEAWEQTELTQTEFAMMLREEADLYEEAPEMVVNQSDIIASTEDVIDKTGPVEGGPL